MRYILTLAIFLLFSFGAFNQTVYTFNGNGNWSNSANWVNQKLPPDVLLSGDEIIIAPGNNGQCILDRPQTIFSGAKLTIQPNIKFVVKGELNAKGDSTFTDPRDGQIYTYKTIGSQVWMTKNLNYAAPGSLCYDDDPANCVVYGRLYDWNTALTVAPPGWHLPSDEEWTTLVRYLGGFIIAGGKMKATVLWRPDTSATNSSGFAALPGGEHEHDEDAWWPFNGLGDWGGWWSSTELDTGYIWNLFLRYYDAYAFWGDGHKFTGFSVRCVRDRQF